MADQEEHHAIELAAVTAVQLPRFWADDPELWFLQVENQFSIHRITSQTRRYELLFQALPPSAISEVRDVLLAPRGDDPYDFLKKTLITRLVASEQRRLQQLLSAEEMGDRRPSQFLRHLQHLLGNKASTLDTAILRELFLQRLPASVRVALVSAHGLPLSELADLADKIMEAAVVPVATATMINVTDRSPTLVSLASDIADLRAVLEKSTVTAAINATEHSPSLTSLASDIAELRSAIRQLSCDVASLRHETLRPWPTHDRMSDSRRCPSSSPARRSSPLPRSSEPVCSYHRRFGADARRCVSPCSFLPGNQAAGR